MIQNETRNVINNLLVDLFNDILKIEASVIKESEFNDLSVTEIHIIEAIGLQREMTMTQVARELDITVGTLTIAINRLIKKEYVKRRRIEEDRRVVLIKLTEKGNKAFKVHSDFHDDMIRSMMKDISKEEGEALINALKKMVKFFKEKK